MRYIKEQLLQMMGVVLKLEVMSSEKVAMQWSKVWFESGLTAGKVWFEAGLTAGKLCRVLLKGEGDGCIFRRIE